MDLHIIPGADPEDVAKAHLKDLSCQDEFGCRAITYWFDGHRGKAFCLIEAPDANAVSELHEKAHGLVPNQVTQVDPSLVESFLGRLSDPEDAEPGDSGLRVIDDTAYRYLLGLCLPDFNLLTRELRMDEIRAIETFVIGAVEDLSARFSGRRVKYESDTFFYSFTELEHALQCAESVRLNCREHSPFLKLKMAVKGGEPLNGEQGFFEEVSDGLKVLVDNCPAECILLASDLRARTLRLKGGDNGPLTVIDAEEEDFLQRISAVLEKSFMNPNLDVTVLASKLAYSNSKLYRMCKEMTGVSPSRFVRDYRLKRAKSLIRHTSDSVSEIGFQCGFNTPSYFTRCFQEKYGLAPMEYRSV